MPRLVDEERAAAELRDIVAATFVSLAERLERCKKFSGTQQQALSCLFCLRTVVAG